MKHLLSTLMACAYLVSASAQTGPGGVLNNDGSSNLSLWLDASTLSHNNNTSISTWTDQSGYNNHAYSSAGKRPVFKTNTLNGYPVMDFTATASHHFYVHNHSSLNPNKISMFVVGKYTSASSQWASFVIKCSDWYWEDGYGLTRWSWNSQIEGFVNDYNSNYKLMNVSTNTDAILSMIYNKSKVQVYLDGDSKGSDNYSSNISNTNNKLFIGISPDEYGTGTRDPLDGHIAEVIIFNTNLNSAQRILVNNYLGAKYGIENTDDNVYAHDTPANGNYDHDVAGIGRINNSNKSTSGQGTGIIKMSNPSNLGNREFLMWGNDGNNLTFTNTTDVPPGVEHRLSRTWRVSERRNDNYNATNVGNVDLQVDLSGLSGVTEENLRLLVDTDNDGSLTDETPISGATEISSNVFVFSQTAALTDNVRFSFAIKNAITWDGVAFDLGSGTNNAPGSTDQTKDFVVFGTGGVITGSGAVKDVLITGSGEITISAGVTVTVTGNIQNNGTITLDDGASLVQTVASNGNTGTGTYIIKRTGNNSSNVYNIWSSPIANASQTNVFNNTNACDIWTFDGQDQSWKYDYAANSNINCLGNAVTVPAAYALTGGDNNMDAGRGYFIPGSANATRTFTGVANNGLIQIPIYTTNLGNNPNWDDDDWNLVGNPYPSAIDAALFWQENAVINNRITNAVYFWDEGSASTGYHQNNDYATWNLLGGTSSNNSSQLPSGQIASGQGFWVYATSNTNLVFNNGMRTGTNGQFFKSQEMETHRAWISLESPSQMDNNILIGFNDQTTDQFDNGFDAHKYAGNAHIKLASLIGNEEFAIQGIAALLPNSEKIIPLSVFSADSGLHVFKELRRENLSTEYTIYLVDKVKQKTYNLSTGSASILLSAGVTYTQRFELVFTHDLQSSNTQNGSGVVIGGSPKITTSLDEVQLLHMTYATQNHTLTISNESTSAGYATLYNLNGQVVENIQVGGESTGIITAWNTASTGIYILKLELENGQVTTHKIVR